MEVTGGSERGKLLFTEYIVSFVQTKIVPEMDSGDMHIYICVGAHTCHGTHVEIEGQPCQSAFLLV